MFATMFMNMFDNTGNTSCISGLCDVTISLNVHDDDGSGRLTGRRASAKARHVTISLTVSDDDGSVFSKKNREKSDFSSFSPISAGTSKIDYFPAKTKIFKTAYRNRTQSLAIGFPRP